MIIVYSELTEVGGGIAVYIKCCFSVLFCLDTCCFCVKLFVHRSLILVSNDSVVVAGMYSPPSAVTSSINDLTDIHSRYVHSEVIVMDDSNID